MLNILYCSLAALLPKVQTTTIKCKLFLTESFILDVSVTPALTLQAKSVSKPIEILSIKNLQIHPEIFYLVVLIEKKTNF